MKKHRKAKNKPLFIAIISIIMAAVIIGLPLWAIHNSGVKRQVAMNKEIDRIAFPGKVISRTYTDSGCSGGATFGFSLWTCNTSIQETFPRTGDFCADFKAFDMALRGAGYQYSDNEDPTKSPLLTADIMHSKYGESLSTCNYYQEVSAGPDKYREILSYDLNTTHSTTNNFYVSCTIGTAVKPYSLDIEELDAKNGDMQNRPQIYGCILSHN